MVEMHPEATTPNVAVVINDVSYNGSTLAFWNYTVYGNGTLSNGSNCFLAFGSYKPILVSPNGTFVNATSCYQPIHAIGARGITGLVFGSLFAISMLLSTINLRKHGRAYLPRGNRWRPVGRRWPWYWTIFVAACGILSCFTAVDVDRDYIVNTPMVLQCFFLTLMVPALLACVWESVRSWTSIQHHLLEDADAFALPPHAFRAKVDFYLPLAFYSLDWLVFFLAIPRSWSFVQHQRSPSQTVESARPAAVDARFKVAWVLSIFCLLLISFRLTYSSRIYHVRVPYTSALVVGLLALRIAYAIIGSFVWTLSPYRLGLGIGWLYGLGYAPIVLILFMLNLRGYLEDNEDKILIAQRATRGTELEDNSHRTKAGGGRGRQGTHPSWWSKTRNLKASPTRVFQLTTSQQRHRIDDAGKRSSSKYGDQHDESGQYWWHRRKEGEEDARLRKSRHKASITPSGDDISDNAGPSLRWTEREASNLMRTDDANVTGLGANESVDSVNSRLPGRTSEMSSSTHSLESRPQVVRSMLDV